MGNTLESRIAAATETLPVELQRPVEHWFEQLRERHAVPLMPDSAVEALARFVACSEFGGKVILQNWPWFVESVESFDVANGPDEKDLEDLLDGKHGIDALKKALRQFRHRSLLQILWREVFELADLDETLRHLSRLADLALLIATRYAEAELEPRYGRLRDHTGRTVPLVILGMGKLGGLELNFSSDIDVIFLYTREGSTDGDKSVSAQEYFARLTRLIIALIDEVTTDGIVFRIDTRLRPFGASGPPVVSFAALESYLLQHGRDWERYAYIKARVAGRQPSQEVLDELYESLIKPFVYRRYLDYGVFESLREMHAMIAAEVRRRDLKNNIKLGPGGIREVEFIVQSLQLVRGGSEVSLQGRGLQSVMPKLVSSRGLSAQSASCLLQAYRFLRRTENFIQAMRDQQIHDLPVDTEDRARLCLAMGYADWSALQLELERHRAAVALEFDAVAFRDSDEDAPLRQQLARAWELNASEEAWRERLASTGAGDAAALAACIVEFANDPVTQQIDAIASARLQRFIPVLVLEVIKADRPLASMTRTLAVIERILRRSAYLALLNENRAAMKRLVDLCGRSRYIAEQLAVQPVLLDELLDPHVYTASINKADLSEELSRRLAPLADSDSETIMQSIVQHQSATKFRIAVADFTDSLPIMKVSDGLTWLAETVLEQALRVAWRDMVERFGAPSYVLDGVRHKAGFGIVGYGKLGGLELSYGSDLDIVFLHDSQGESRVTDGANPLDNTLFFARLVRRLVLFLTTQTPSGGLYEIDTRLRPDGRSGLLVTNTEAFERYQVENAWTWEHQALLRARPVAGSDKVAREFERIRRDTLVGRVKQDSLRQDVISMRQRMRKELDRSDAETFDLKNGVGGIGDIEFLVQYLVLSRANAHPEVIVFTDNIRQLDALVETGCLDAHVGARLQECYRTYRLRQHHLVIDGRPPLVGGAAFRIEREFVERIWEQWLH